MKFSFPLRGFGLAAAFLAASAVTAIPVTLDLTTDTFGGETSFDMISDPLGTATPVAFDSHTPPTASLADGFAAFGDLASNTAYVFEWDLAHGDYQFVLNDSFGDGIGVGSATLMTPTGSFVASGNFGTQTTYDFSLVPLPATLALLGIGLAGLGWSSRRARS